ncbi:MAG: ATP-binding protein [Myxococcota bacterium]|jgi:C4-dicarboxylate-specific signal transduction histidine kinase|nr:ATP-binding protein [Myxococcota bacterium]
MVLANRTLAVFAIGVTAVLGTRWQEASQEMAKQQLRLAEVSRVNMAGELASGIAHELNQPLASVLNYAEAASLAVRRGEVSPEKLLKDLQSIADGAELGGQILRRLRGFLAHRPIERSPHNINALVREAMSLLSSERKQLSIDMQIRIPATLPRVMVDPVLIQQVLVNLARNAIEAMQDSETKQLVIRAAQHDSEDVEIAIEDSGKGPERPDIETLFEHFVSTKPEGLGVGLAISRSIVEAHGGHLTAERNPYRGMTFRFTLPPVDAAPSAEG